MFHECHLFALDRGLIKVGAIHRRRWRTACRSRLVSGCCPKHRKAISSFGRTIKGPTYAVGWAEPGFVTLAPPRRRRLEADEETMTDATQCCCCCFWALKRRATCSISNNFRPVEFSICSHVLLLQLQAVSSIACCSGSCSFKWRTGDLWLRPPLASDLLPQALGLYTRIGVRVYNYSVRLPPAGVQICFVLLQATGFVVEG